MYTSHKMWDKCPTKRKQYQENIPFIEMQYNILGNKVLGKKVQLCEQKCIELGKKSEDDEPLKRNSKLFCFSNVTCK